MFKFFKRLGKDWWLICAILLLTAIQVASDFMIPVILGQIIKVLQGDIEDYNWVLNYSIGLALVSAIGCLAAIFNGKCVSVATAKMMARVRQEMYDKINSYSIKEINSFSTSSLITRTTNDITNVSNTINFMLRFALYGPMMAIASIIFLLISSGGPLTALIVGAIVIFIVALIVILKIVLPKYRSLQSKIDKVNLVTKENLEGLRVVRAYNAESYQENKFEGVNNDLMVTDKFANRGINFIMPVIQLVIGLLSVSIAWVASVLISNNQFSYAQMVQVNEFSLLLLYGLILMVAVFLQLPRSMVCAKRINEVIETNGSIVGKEVTPETKEVGTIEFKNVSFTYPGGEAPAIQNVSFKVKKGETIAFIGATGAGKTTLISLMPRLSDVTEGEVLIDGINVKDYNYNDLLSKFGYVPQKPYLFHDTLRNNVCLGKPNASNEEFKRALDISQSSEFVSKLTNGYEYEISQGGKNVSGGQRQRLSIARAIIMNPEIFIFDDSFSALDYKTDKTVRSEIKTQCAGSTLVIVAQRVGTILDADQIVVLDNGKVMGIGTHKELLKNCEVYKEIALSQLSKEELEK